MLLSSSTSDGYYGGRKTMDITPEYILVGIPMTKLPEIVKAVSQIKEGLIPKSRVK
jgi:uncharacterized protein (DUF169 family)